MTIGICILSLDTNDKVYIGQSLNIEDRWDRHARDLKKNKHHSYKLQLAYNKGVVFNYSILEKTDSGLDTKEIEYIREFDSYYNGYNCTNAIGATGSGYGSCSASYSKEKYVQIVSYLAYTSLDRASISKELEVSENTISNISTLRRHGWIELEMPLEYEILKAKYEVKNTRPRGANPDIEKVFKELVSGNTDVAYLTSTYSLSLKQIQHMCYGESHKWLKTLYPIEYPVIKHILNTRCKK